MSDDTSTSTTVDNGSAPAASPQSVSQVEANKLEDLPTFWQTEVKNLRREGQNKGSRLTELTQELENARAAATQRESDLSAQIAADRLQHARFVAVVEAGVPLDRAHDIASRLRGETEDELKADARQFGDLFRSNQESRRGVDHSQGAGNGSGAPASPADQLTSQLRGLLGR